MSGGYFDRNVYAIGEIADSIERDIARALRPKPEKIHKDYWTIYEKDSFGSYHSYMGYLYFSNYEEAESFLLTDKTIVKAEQRYSDQHFFVEGVIFQSTKRYMSDTYDADVLELTDETIETMKEAYRQIRIAEIYATRMDWMMSGDDGEDSFRERIKEDLAEFKKEYAAKDWTHINENEE